MNSFESDTDMGRNSATFWCALEYIVSAKFNYSYKQIYYINFTLDGLQE